MTTNIYQSKEWKKLRVMVLRRDSYSCVFCNSNLRGKGLSRVDHIVPVKEDPSRAFDMDNLRSLCSSCDNRRHYTKKRKDEYKKVDKDGYVEGWS